MSVYSAGMYDDSKTAEELKQRLESARQERDRLIELNESSLANDGHIGETELTSPDDVGQYLRDCGFSDEVADFYAEGVRLGHNVIIFESDQDDEHFAQVASEMRAREPHHMEEKLERWKGGDRSVFASEARGTEPSSSMGRQSTAPSMGGEASEQGRAGTRGEERIPVTEERARVGKKSTERGGVSVTTHVEEQPIEEEVNLREEHVEVERKPVDRPLEAGEQAFEDKQVEFTERSEEPMVTKEARVVEEVVIGKESTERTVLVQDVIRRTVVDIDTYGDLDDEMIRADFEARGGGQSWEDYQKGAKFGHAYGSHVGLRDVEYEEAEPELRQRYEEREGKGAFDRARDSVRSWWHRARQG